MSDMQSRQGRDDLPDVLAVAAILAYRRAMYPVYRALRLTGQRSACKLHPSCSHYGEQAVRVHGLRKAFVMTSARLRRCGLTDRIDDPVPAPPYFPTRVEQVEAGKALAIITAVVAAGVWVGDRIGWRIH
ncbi:membrane protein insertion efficiency factor YidD [Schlegelella sp. S2-27]|uniref:Membrane protein insertion efficiency factor YidD n=1 Tax=Caldimonas mangrovi TaxID=2944811 RepID=A0ABT0YUY9_9BURK|nr:membrane protein insertion efficiency factor YidD [Caldimonas mangrovi]MCM5682423.1 membrane protein insertion efficiency factor YidD [Caldimonas mangrovi]